MAKTDRTERRPQEPSGTRLATARLCWQLGDWGSLFSKPAPKPTALPMSEADTALEMLRMEAAFHLGAVEEGQAIARNLIQCGVDRRQIAAALLGGAMGCVARAWLVLRETDRARDASEAALRLRPDAGDAATVAGVRLERETARIERETGLDLRGAAGGRKLFIDCGGYDGCSALMFLLAEPDFECVSFEPNPDLWVHYDGLPTRLIRKAAFTYDGEIDFTIDPVDGDGSTLVAGKRVDFTRSVADEDCPVLRVPCVDLSAFIRTAAQTHDRIVLKLDVEGAEYDILEHLLREGTIGSIERLYCEFHGHKMQIEPGRHERVVAAVEKHVKIEFWDALSFSLSAPDSAKKSTQRRQRLLQAIRSNQRRLRGDTDTQDG